MEARGGTQSRVSLALKYPFLSDSLLCGGQSHCHGLAKSELTPFLSLVTYHILLEAGAGWIP